MKKPSLISFGLVGKKTVLYFFFFCNFCSDGKRVGMKRLCHLGNQCVVKHPIFQQTSQHCWLVVAVSGGISVLQSSQFLLRDLYQTFTYPLLYSLWGRNRYDMIQCIPGKHALPKINIYIYIYTQNLKMMVWFRCFFPFNQVILRQTSR